MDDARTGKVRAVVVWALDRLDRSMVGCLNRVVELDRLGVPVVSVREAWLDTLGPTRPLLLAIFGWVAEQERARIAERTRAGLARVAKEEATEAGRARRRALPVPKGPIGRPRASPVLLHAAADLVGRPTVASTAMFPRTWTVREVSRKYGLAESTLRRYLRTRAG